MIGWTELQSKRSGWICKVGDTGRVCHLQTRSGERESSITMVDGRVRRTMTGGHGKRNWHLFTILISIIRI